MTIAKSISGSEEKIEVEFPEEQSRARVLTMIPPPKYDDLFLDDEPTLKMVRPPCCDTLPAPSETRYPGVGFVIAFLFVGVFWYGVYLLFT